jgi:hypothetical protein
VLHDTRAKSNGQFVFTTKAAGEYKACFVVHGKRRKWQGQVKIVLTVAS